MSDDPGDLPTAASTPSNAGDPARTNPMASTASTTPTTIASSTPTPANQASSVDPPAAFVAAVKNALSYRLGPTKFGLIPSADMKSLIDKIWQDPQLQTYYLQNINNLKDPTISGTLGLQINEVMMGQGNDPTVAVDYTNMLQAAGVPLTVSEQSALSAATQAVNARVPDPFGQAVKVSGYDWSGGANLVPTKQGPLPQTGVDYGTTAGSRIVSPFAGTIIAQTNVQGYGNIVYVQLDNGWKIGFGHVGAIEAQNGARVNPGDLIAIAGANVGASEGSVTIVTWQDPKGKYVNPHEVMDPIFGGATFSQLNASGAAGTGMPSVNKVLDAEYPSIKSDWQTFFGTPPSPEDVYNVLNHGSSPAQWSDYIRSLPSHMDGLNQGQYYDMRQMADGVSTKVLGHPATDSIVAELAKQGITSQQAVTNWYNEHGVTGVPAPGSDDYQKIYKATQPINANIFGEPAGADPRDIRNIYNVQGKTRQTGGQSE